MKKNLLATTGTFALVGALAGLASFGGMALAAPSTPSTPAAPAVSTAITQSVVAPSVKAPTPTTATTTNSDQEKATGEEAHSPQSDKENINYQEQGNHQGNNGVAESGQSTDNEKSTPEENQSGPDTDNIQLQQ